MTTTSRTLLSPLVALALAVPLTMSTSASADQAVSIASLLEEMVDRDRLAQLPSPAYDCAQFSSYDRKSTTPDDPDTWYANWDRSQFVRIDEKDGEKEYVLMDTEGPGAIVRFWATWHGPKGKPFSNGTLRVYLDGSDKPAIEGPITEVIDGGLLTKGPLSQGVSPQSDYRRQGHNLYLPIPYAKQCKVTYTTDVPVDVGGKTGEALYYQINYRTYEAGTKVESFSMEGLEKVREQLDQTQKTLLNAQRDPSDDWKSESWDGELKPQESKEIAKFDSTGSIRRLRVKLDSDASAQALRSTILKIEFDGEPTVWAPIGDFFGVGYKPAAYQTWYTAYTDQGEMSCEWVMPFEKNCKVSLENVGTQNVKVDVAEVYVGDWEWNDRSLHFCATWHELTGAQTGAKKKTMDNGDGVQDVNYVTIQGQGVYVGDTLTLFNGADTWWGEGDEKIYVDGEDFPSHFGTGTEDYYGYAWCRPESFHAPFHAQPEGNGNLKAGFSVNSRYRALDAIPFAKSLKVDMELWHWTATTMNYAPSAFFYVRPGATSNVKPAPESAALPVVTTVDELAGQSAQN